MIVKVTKDQVLRADKLAKEGCFVGALEVLGLIKADPPRSVQHVLADVPIDGGLERRVDRFRARDYLGLHHAERILYELANAGFQVVRKP